MTSDVANILEGLFAVYLAEEKSQMLIVLNLLSEYSAKYNMQSGSVNFISLVTSCVGLEEVDTQIAHPMSLTLVSHIAASVLVG